LGKNWGVGRTLFTPARGRAERQDHPMEEISLREGKGWGEKKKERMQGKKFG